MSPSMKGAISFKRLEGLNFFEVFSAMIARGAYVARATRAFKWAI